MKYLLLTLFVGTILITNTAYGQNLESLGGQSGARSIQTVPPHPGPHQLTTITVESFSTDLNRATISWFLNNNPVKEATGQKNFSFKTGSLGSISNILIVVKTPGGAVIQETINISPASVDLVWEAESYTPPFYKGKALYQFQGNVKVVALPNIITTEGGSLEAKNMVYTWKVDGHPAGSASGYGKNFILFRGDVPLKPATVSVEVSSTDGAYVATNSTTLNPVQPGIVLYEDSPLLGILYEQALAGNIALRNTEIKITAIPYFLGVAERDGNGLIYNWLMNGQKITAGGEKSSVTFRQDKGAAGNATISLNVTNPIKVFQTIDASVNLLFGSNTAVSQF